MKKAFTDNFLIYKNKTKISGIVERNKAFAHRDLT